MLHARGMSLLYENNRTKSHTISCSLLAMTQVPFRRTLSIKVSNSEVYRIVSLMYQPPFLIGTYYTQKDY